MCEACAQTYLDTPILSASNLPLGTYSRSVCRFSNFVCTSSNLPGFPWDLARFAIHAQKDGWQVTQVARQQMP
eukprot:5224063-Amphidinium_carterae.1